MSTVPRIGRPWNHRRRRKTGCAWRRAMSPAVKASRSSSASRPVEPGDLVVLAVGVVVAALRAADLVAAEQHRHALRQQQRGQQVALLACPQREHLGVVGRSLDAAVPRAVVVLAVAVVLAVGLVVLLVVGDEVAQREAVVRGDEVDAGRRAPARRPGRGRSCRSAGSASSPTVAGVAAPEVAHGVAVLAVPLRPRGGKLPTW